MSNGLQNGLDRGLAAGTFEGTRRGELSGVVGNDLRRNLKSSLLYYWDLDNGALNTITDSVSGLVLNRFGGTINTLLNAAPDGLSCIEMTTGGYYINNSVPPISGYNNYFTYNVWVYSYSQSGIGNWAISHRSNGTNDLYIQILSYVNGTAEADFFTNTGVFYNFQAIQLNTWYMVTAIRRGEILELWINGKIVTAFIQAVITGPTNTLSAAFSIGSPSWIPGNTSFVHRGRLFATGVWNKALSKDEIVFLYNNGRGRRFNNL
jgi:hypothetical protein